MAVFYWVPGGTGNWSSPTNWSNSSGGAAGSTIPGAGDAVLFNSSSGSGTATLDTNFTILTLNMSGFTGTLAFSTNTISLASTGIIYTGSTTFTVTGTPVINVTSTGSTEITIIPGAVTEANAISFNFTGGTYTLTMSSGAVRNVNFTGFSGTTASLGGVTVYGSLTISTGMTLSASAGILTFGGTSGTQDITSNGKTFNVNMTFSGSGGTFRLLDAMSIPSGRSCTLSSGTLNLNNNTLTTASSFSSSNSNVRAIAFGTGSIVITNTGTVWDTSTVGNFSVTGTPNVNITNSTSTAVTVYTGSTTESGAVSFNFTNGSYNLTLAATGSNFGAVVKDLNFTGFSGTLLTLGSNGSIYGSLTLSTTMTLQSGSSVYVQFPATTATQNITSNGKIFPYEIRIGSFLGGVSPTFKLLDNFSCNSVTFESGTLDISAGTFTCSSFGLGSGTSISYNLFFGTSRIILATGGFSIFLNTGCSFFYSGTFRVDSTYSGSTGTRAFYIDPAAGTISLSVATSGANFNIGTAGTDTVTFQGYFNSINLTGFNGTWGNASNLYLYGNLTIGSGTTVGSGSNILYFAANSGIQDINSNGKTFDFPVYLSGSGGTVRLQSNLTVTSTNTFTVSNATTLNLNNLTLTTGLLSATASTIAFGTGSINLTGTGTIWSATGTITVSGTPVVNVNNATATATTVSPGTQTEANSVSFNFTIGTYTLTLTGTVRSVDFTGFAGTLANGTRTVYGNFKLSTGTTLTAGTLVTTFSATSGTQNITSNGKTIDFPVTFNGTGGTFKPLDALVIGSTRTATLTAGSLDISTAALTTGLFVASGTGTRSILFGTNIITVTGNNATVVNVGGTNFSYTGTFNITSNYTGATGTRTFAGDLIAANTYPNLAASGAQINVGSSATDTILLSGSLGDVNFTGITQTLANNAITTFIYGNLTIGSDMTLGSGTGTVTMAGTGTQFVTSNGKTFDFPIGFNGIGGTFKLQDALTVGSTRTTGLTNGTLDLNGQTLTTGLFASSSSNTRTLAFGTSTINLTGTGTVWNTSTSTNLTVTGTPIVNVNHSTATATTVSCGSLSEANSISYNFTAGTYALSLTGNMKSLNLTGFAGTLGNAARTIYGNLTISTGATVTSGSNTTTFAGTSGVQLITSNGNTCNHPFTFNGVGGTFRLVDALTTGSLRVTTLTAGTLDLNGQTFTMGTFSSSGTGTRTLAFGTGNMALTTTGSIWDTSVVTGLTVTGNPVVNITNNTATATSITAGALSESNAISFNFTSGTYALTFLGTSGDTVKNLNFTGYNGTLGAMATSTLYGNLTLAAGMTLTASANIVTFGSTVGTQTITSNGKTMDFPITCSGAGTRFLADAMTLGSTRAVTLTGGTFDGNNKTLTAATGITASTGSSSIQNLLTSAATNMTVNASGFTLTVGGDSTVGGIITHTNGTIDLNGKTLTSNTRFLTATGTKNLTFNGGTLAITAANTTAFNNAQPTGFTTTAGTGVGKISMTAATAKTFVGGGSTYNCTLSNDGAGALTINGSNTFTTIANGVQPTTFTFTSNTTTTLTNWYVKGVAGSLVTIGSTTAQAHTLSKASGIVKSEYLSISRSTATGGATWYAGTTSTNGTGNTGWLFTNAPVLRSYGWIIT